MQQMMLEQIQLTLIRLCHIRILFQKSSMDKQLQLFQAITIINQNSYTIQFQQEQISKLVQPKSQENRMFAVATSTANSHNQHYLNRQSDSTGHCYDAPNLYSGGKQDQPSNLTSSNFLNQQIDIEKIVASIENYTPVTQIIDINSLRKARKQIKQEMTTNSSQKYVAIKKYRQAVFFGECNTQNKKQGKGIMLYTNGRVYQGDWQDNMKQGKGYEKFNNGSVYLGDYKKGKPEGFGRYQWANGEVYQGEWIDGLKNGSGIWRGSKGDSYIGEWKDGQADGYGVHTWINGDRYQGQFKNCLKHGQGLQKFSNGDSYKGNYQNGKPYGYGQYYWGSGSYFKGNFKNGLRQGRGVWRGGHGNGDRYEGEYRNDKKEGQGIFTWANGNIYKGDYLDDLRHGYGQMQWNDGTCYKGNWVEGVQQQTNLMEDSHSNNIIIRVTPRTVRDQTSYVNEIPLNNQEDFFEFEDRANYYNQPERPAIMDKPRRQFRARGLTSNKTTRQRSVRAETPQSKIYLNSSFNQPPRLNKKYSMGSKVQYNAKRRSHSKFSSSCSQNNQKNNQIMSASFFMYKIHKDNNKNHNQSHNFMHSSSNQSYNCHKHTPSDLQNSGIHSGRQIKTSGGFRQKKIADEINYFTNKKLNNPQFF